VRRLHPDIAGRQDVFIALLWGQQVMPEHNTETSWSKHGKSEHNTKLENTEKTAYKHLKKLTHGETLP
jgi:hypothetical protein